jgi:steroid 5-alpha reductase family enzyme
VLVVLAGVLVFMLAAMNAAWVFQRSVGNSGWIDVFWTFATGAAGVAAALLPFADQGRPGARQLLVAAIIAIWAVRLGTYVGHRVATSAEDRRYAHFRKQWGSRYQATLWLFVLPQALISTLLCWSIAVAAHRPQAGLDMRDAAGAAALIVAIAGEALADRELAAFKRAHRERGAICDVGLWRWSRHPNYFFEWLGWLAYPVIGLDLGEPAAYATLAAPAAMFLSLRFATGVRPLEAVMLASRGEAYRAYQRRTSAFVPLPPRHGAVA